MTAPSPAPADDSAPLTRYAFAERFECLGADCEDTCCRGWNMQFDPVRRALYEREDPELLAAITESDAGTIMKRDPETDYCVKFDGGLCAVHASHGTDFLGDACHFYPRITRQVGDRTVMSAALSCPETVRIILFEDDPFVPVQGTIDRVPVTLKNYLPDGLNAEAALGLCDGFMALAADTQTPPEQAMMRIVAIARALLAQSTAQWPAAFAFYRGSIGERLPPARPNVADPYRVLHALGVLMSASQHRRNARLTETFQQMELALNASMNWESRTIENRAADLVASDDLIRRMQAVKPWLDRILRRWLQAQLAAALYPLSGFGGDAWKCALILALRFVTVRQALTSHMREGDSSLPPDITIRIIQSLSRFMDHLADPTLSLAIYKEAGWCEDAPLRGLLRDDPLEM